MSEVPILIGEKRYNDPITGRFVEGNPGGGRPAGSTSLVSLLKAKLEECPEGMDKKTFAQLIIDRVLSDALKLGDSAAMKLIWSYIEGMPKQAIDVKGEGFENKTLINIHPSKTVVFKDVDDSDIERNRNLHVAESPARSGTQGEVQSP